MAVRPLSTIDQIKQFKIALDSLSILRGLRSDRVIDALYSLLDCLNEKNSLSTFLNSYNELYYTLTSCDEGSFRDHLVDVLLFQEHPFARKIVSGSFSQTLEEALAHDLNRLQLVSNLKPALVKEQAMNFFSQYEQGIEAIGELPVWPTDWTGDSRMPAVTLVKQRLASSRCWGDCVPALAEFYQKQGMGIFARYRAFVWEQHDGAGSLKGIDDPDRITLNNLIGYEHERSDVIENTLQFLNGYPANNVLLYGDRGTGKSSTVKAILNEYHDKGLRVIEVSKAHLVDFKEIVRLLREQAQKFIIFVDDLSFEDSEASYTAMKAVLEGGLESKPGNVLIYATSNRRHLIKEKFSDRSQSSNNDDEIRMADTMQEKLSLSDRFGITVIFPSPDQEKYLAIVEGIAAQRGLLIGKEELRRDALQWALWYNGRSPRTGRQFVDWLEGHAALKDL